jgi:LemA protein
VRSLLAVVEAYPELRVGESFLDLQARLVEVENHLQMARRYYNGAVRDYNTAVESFPSNLVAHAAGFGLEPFFQVESALDRATPEVRL